MFFHTKSVPEPRWSTSAVRRVRDGLGCGRIILGSSSDHSRIGIPLWFATVGSFPHGKFGGSLARNAFLRDSRCTKPYVFPYKKSVPEPRWSTSAVRRVRDGLGCGRIILGSSSDHSRIGIRLWFATVGSFPHGKFGGSLARNAFLRDSRCTKPYVFPYKKSVPEPRWSTSAVRRVRDGLGCGRIILGSSSDHSRIGIPLWFATVGSFPHGKFGGSLARNAFLRDSRCTKPYVFPYKKSVPEPRWSTSAVRRVRDGLGCGRIILGPSSDHSRIGIPLWFATVGSFPHGKFEGSLARNPFLRDSRCTKPYVFPYKKSVPEPRWSTSAVRRVRDGLGCGRIILGSSSDHSRIGIPLWFATVGSFPHGKFGGSLARNAFLRDSRCTKPYVFPYKKSVPEPRWSTSAVRRVRDGLGCGRIILGSSSDHSRIGIPLWFATVGSFPHGKFEGSLARNPFLRDSRCTKPYVFPYKKSVPEPRWSTSAVRRVRDGLGCGRIILGSSSDHSRIGIPLWFATVGSFPHGKFGGSLARNAFLRDSRCTKPYVFPYKKSVPEPRWSTSAVRRVRDGLGCGRIILGSSSDHSRIGIRLWFATVGSFPHGKFGGSLARNAFLRDSRCTKPYVFPYKVCPRTSMIYLCGATGARRSRVWSDHSRILLGSFSNRYSIMICNCGIVPTW